MVELLTDGLEDVGMGEADLVDVIAVEIEDLAALPIGEGGALDVAQDIEAGGGEGLVEEIAGVLLEPVAGVVADMAGAPGLAARGKVEVAFGAEEVEIGGCGRGARLHGRMATERRGGVKR